MDIVRAYKEVLKDRSAHFDWTEKLIQEKVEEICAWE